MDPLIQNYLLVGLASGGAGLLFGLADWRSAASRAQALCLLLIGGRLLAAPLLQNGWWPALLGGALEVGAILAGIEWARRIGRTATQRLRRPIHSLFRASQILVLIYAGLALGYLSIAPEAAMRKRAAFIDLGGLEWALFAPVLGTAMLLSGIAILMLLIVRTDPAESIRLRALALAAPLLIAGLVVGDAWVPLVLMLGLLVFMAGTGRYLIVQAQRAQSLSQFLSPEIARLVQLRGVERVLRREKREISVVVCDLRGFTAFAAAQESEAVVGLLERYYAVVGEVAQVHGGTIKDHAGDGVVILVGAPIAHRDCPRRAAALALELVARVAPLLKDCEPALGIAAGVASGEMVVGAIQGSGRLEYVAVGTPVNLAARLCQCAASGEVIADAASAAQAGEAVCAVPLSLPALKGFDRTPEACRLSAAGA